MAQQNSRVEQTALFLRSTKAATKSSKQCINLIQAKCYKMYLFDVFYKGKTDLQLKFWKIDKGFCAECVSLIAIPCAPSVQVCVQSSSDQFSGEKQGPQPNTAQTQRVIPSPPLIHLKLPHSEMFEGSRPALSQSNATHHFCINISVWQSEEHLEEVCSVHLQHR